MHRLLGDTSHHLILTQHHTQTNIRSDQHRAGILVYTSKTGSGTVTQRSITGKLLSDATNAPINVLVKPHHPPRPPLILDTEVA